MGWNRDLESKTAEAAVAAQATADFCSRLDSVKREGAARVYAVRTELATLQSAHTEVAASLRDTADRLANKVAVTVSLREELRLAQASRDQHVTENNRTGSASAC